jgi:hypothetical protein
MMRFLEESAQNSTPTRAPSELTFSSFDQVMLALPKVEEGLTFMFRTFHRRWLATAVSDGRQVSPSDVAELTSEEFTNCLRLCGAEEVTEDKIRASIRSMHEFEETIAPEAPNDEDQNLTITFSQAISSNIVFDHLIPSGSSVMADQKTKKAFQIVRATFEMLDTDGDGEISPEELKSGKSKLVGELAYGNQMFKVFKDQQALTIGDLATLFAKWTIFHEVEETQLCAEFVGSNRIEMRLDTADDVVSELSDEPKLSDGTGPSDSDSAKPLVQEGTSGDDNANKPAGLFRRASNFKGGDEFSDK